MLSKWGLLMGLLSEWMLNNKDKVGHFILTPLALVLTFLGGYYAHAPSVQTEEHVVFQERVIHQTHTIYKDIVVEKVVYQEQKQQKRDVDRTYIKEVRPDGTKVVVVHENTKEEKTSNTSVSKEKTESITLNNTTKDEKTVQEKVDKKTTIEYSQPQWRLSVGVGVLLPELSKKGLLDRQPTYSLEVDRKIAGTLWLGVEAGFNTNLSSPLIIQGKIGVEL